MECLGHRIHEVDIKRGLQELNPGVNFDMGAKLGIDHPHMNVRQGVFLRGKHVGSLDRGLVPEHQIVVRDASREDHRGDATWREGWRRLFEKLIKKGVVTRRQLSDKFALPDSFWVRGRYKFLIDYEGEAVEHWHVHGGRMTRIDKAA